MVKVKGVESKDRVVWLCWFGIKTITWTRKRLSFDDKIECARNGESILEGNLLSVQARMSILSSKKI